MDCLFINANMPSFLAWRIVRRLLHPLPWRSLLHQNQSLIPCNTNIIENQLAHYNIWWLLAQILPMLSIIFVNQCTILINIISNCWSIYFATLKGQYHMVYLFNIIHFNFQFFSNANWAGDTDDRFFHRVLCVPWQFSIILAGKEAENYGSFIYRGWIPGPRCCCSWNHLDMMLAQEFNIPT